MPPGKPEAARYGPVWRAAAPPRPGRVEGAARELAAPPARTCRAPAAGTACSRGGSSPNDPPGAAARVYQPPWSSAGPGCPRRRVSAGECGASGAVLRGQALPAEGQGRPRGW